MVRMVPSDYSQSTNFSERQVFNALEGAGHPDWSAFHALTLAYSKFTFQSENDFTVFVPGKGIVTIEVKNAKSVSYEGGRWMLEGVPNPSKSPFEQIDRVRGNIRAYLKQFDEELDNIPFARAVWFPNIGREALSATPGDASFFEWELLFSSDLKKPAEATEKVLDQCISFYADNEHVHFDPATFTVERADRLGAHLVGSFHAAASPAAGRDARATYRRKLLDEQVALLELVETNQFVYFDGAAGTGKSYLLAEAARRLAKSGKRVLVTCWNVLMADELANLAMHPNIRVLDVGALARELAGVADPVDADDLWFTQTLPDLAAAAIQADPALAEYEALCIDEFQDVAGNLRVLNLLFRTLGGGLPRSRVVLAGDARQQILAANRVADPFRQAKALMPELVNVRLRTNCRANASLGKAVNVVAAGRSDVLRYRDTTSHPNALRSMVVSDADQVAALRSALEQLLTTYTPAEIRVLSPFGANSSVAAQVLAREPKSPDEKWLHRTLRKPGDPNLGTVDWFSVSKFKGLEAEAVVLTDYSARAQTFAAETDTPFEQTAYVGLTRARSECVVIGDAAPALG